MVPVVGLEVGVEQSGARRESLVWIVPEEAGEQVQGLGGYLGMNSDKTRPEQGKETLEDV